jgi:hypothetical protein
MKNQLFIAMMLMVSLLFIATGASAQYCAGCTYERSPYLTAAGSGEQQGTQEFVPAVPATEEGREEMVAVGAAGMTGLRDAHENAAQFATGRELCGYCSVFERAGFP